MENFEFILVLTVVCCFWYKFQENWAAKYSWFQQDHERDGIFNKVRCIICSKVNGINKILDAKYDNMKKHQG